MKRELFGHPFSSYTWKALIALYETETPFTFRNIAGDQFPENEAAFLEHWPVGKFPLLVEDGEPIMKDVALLPIQLEGLETLVEDLRIIRLPGAGHFAPWEAPEAVADALEPFLAEDVSATAPAA